MHDNFLIKSINKLLFIRLKLYIKKTVEGKGCFHKAIKLCLHMNSNARESFLISSFLGYAYFQIADYQLAEKYLVAALKKRPEDYYSTFFLARSLLNLGRKEEALALFTICCANNIAHAEEILTIALPLASEIRDSFEANDFFNQSKVWISSKSLPLPLEVKILFFLADDKCLREKLNNANPCELLDVSLRYIHSVADWVLKTEGNFVELGSPERIRFVNPPKDNEPVIYEAFIDSSVPYIAEVSEATLISGSSLIFVNGDIVLSDLLADREYGHFASFEYDKTVVLQRVDALLTRNVQYGESIQEGIMLAGLASEHYGHWFAEYLPKLRLFKQHPRFSEIPIIVDEGMPTSHYDFLRTLVTNRLYILKRGCSVKIERLLVAPTTTFFPIELFPNHTVPPERQGACSVSALRYIREEVNNKIDSIKTKNDRIFLSRRNSKWRRLVNESEIIDELESHGFRVVFLEELSFEEQVGIFQNAKFIVAPNGSALNNLVFSDVNTKVLIFTQHNPHNWGGWLGPMMDLGYKLRFVSGDAIGDEKNKHSDYKIPTESMRSALIDMLIS